IKARERVPNHRASKKYFSFRRQGILRRPSTFLLPSASTNFTLSPPEGHTSQEYLVSSYLSAKYCLGVPEVDPNKKPRKNFFVKNDHAQYGKEFFHYILLNIKVSKNICKKMC